MSKIEWTELTWNPIIGCSEVSPGCTNCYAVRWANRFPEKDAYKNTVKKLENGRTVWTGHVNKLESKLREPIINQQPSVYFVNSMSDLFHEHVPFHFIDLVFATMAIAKHHTFQILTKRPQRMLEWFEYKDPAWANPGMQGDERIRFQTYHTYGQQITSDQWQWPLPNVWIGVSVEDQKRADLRIPLLIKTPAAVRFLSCEPLLEQIDLKLTNRIRTNDEMQLHESTASRSQLIDWIIVGGESGAEARPMHPNWVRNIRDQCKDQNVPFFFKQWGQWKEIKSDDYHHYNFTGYFDWNGDFQKVGKCIFLPKFGLMPNDCRLPMAKVLKKDAGRELDGVIHNALPLKLNSNAKKFLSKAAKTADKQRAGIH